FEGLEWVVVIFEVGFSRWEISSDFTDVTVAEIASASMFRSQKICAPVNRYEILVEIKIRKEVYLFSSTAEEIASDFYSFNVEI
ncbi:hypothetical protein SUGI_0778670, partial [Cryptomeria japonica]